MKRTVFVIDDEVDFLNSIREFLENDQFEVICFQSGEDLFQTQQTPQHCLYLVDWNLPGINGCEIIKKIRRRDKISPIFIISGNNKHEQILEGLKSGADDYITKPFSTQELMARIRSVLRRRSPQQAEDAVSIGELHLDGATHRVTLSGTPLKMGPTEFKLLNFLMHHTERVHSRSQLLDKVWGDHVFIEERTVDVHVKRLREALGLAGHMIETVRGVGYRFKNQTIS
jgi:two-component system phosphate regulon response regulator PhoB